MPTKSKQQVLEDRLDSCISRCQEIVDGYNKLLMEGKVGGVAGLRKGAAVYGCVKQLLVMIKEARTDQDVLEVLYEIYD